MAKCRSPGSPDRCDHWCRYSVWPVCPFHEVWSPCLAPGIALDAFWAPNMAPPGAKKLCPGAHTERSSNMVKTPHHCYTYFAVWGPKMEPSGHPNEQKLTKIAYPICEIGHMKDCIAWKEHDAWLIDLNVRLVCERYCFTDTLRASDKGN